MSTPDGSLTPPQPPVGGMQITLQNIYLKDCSYESPNGPRLPDGQNWDPKFQLNMNTTANDLGGPAKEVVLTITLEAKHGEAVLYLVEVKQAGIFTIEGGNNEDLQRVVGSFCPTVLFPYARESVSALVAKGGFPAFLLPLVNFDALLQQAAAQSRSGVQVN